MPRRYHMMGRQTVKVLVTGAAGFIGSSLVDALLARGDSVVGIDNLSDYYSPERKRKNIANALQSDSFTFYEEDFRDRSKVFEIFESEKPERIAHLGAMGSVRYSVKNPEIYITTNILGTSNLLEAATAISAENFVFASTSSVYGQREEVPFVETDSTDLPLAPYPASKKAGEVLGHAFQNMHGLPFTALRFFNVYGPKGRPDMMPFMVLDNIVNKREITLFDGGDMYRDWTFIEDILSGVIGALDNPHPYERVNLGRGEPISMVEFMKIAEELTGESAIIREVPAPRSEPKRTFAGVEKAGKLYGYQPTVSLANGFASFWEWYKANCTEK